MNLLRLPTRQDSSCATLAQLGQSSPPRRATREVMNAAALAQGDLVNDRRKETMILVP